MDIELEGVDELVLKLDDISDIDLRRPMLKVGNDIETTAKVYCAGRFSDPTGTLKRSIRSELLRSAGSSKVTGVEVGTNLEYGIYVEHGTGLWAYDGQGRAPTPDHPIPWRYRGSDGMWYTTFGMRPKPFLIPAFNSKKHNIIRYIKEEYDDRF